MSAKLSGRIRKAAREQQEEIDAEDADNDREPGQRGQVGCSEACMRHAAVVLPASIMSYMTISSAALLTLTILWSPHEQINECWAMQPSTHAFLASHR